MNGGKLPPPHTSCPKKCVSRISGNFLILECTSTFLGTCPGSPRGGSGGSPWRHAHWSSSLVLREAEKIAIGKKSKIKLCAGKKEPWLPVLLFQELNDKYKNCTNFKSQTRSRLNGTSADSTWSLFWKELVNRSLPGRTLRRSRVAKLALWQIPTCSSCTVS